MKKLIFSPESIEDLEQIWLYIALDSPANADAFLDKIRIFCQKHLVSSPEIGTSREYLPKDLLAFPFKKYMIYYRFDSDKVEIVRILNGALDMQIIF